MKENRPMTRTTTSRPRMAAIYATDRYAPALGPGGPRRPHRHLSHRGRALLRAVWWLIKTKK